MTLFGVLIWKQFLVSGFFSYWVRINGYLCVFVLVLHCLIFKVLSSSAIPNSVKYALEDFDNPHFAWRRKRSYLRCCFDLSYCSLADSFAIIPPSFPFVNTFLKVFLIFCDFFPPSTFCTISLHKRYPNCAKSLRKANFSEAFYYIL